MDYYLLTLAAVARELNFRGLTEAEVFLAVGLPLTWVGEQKESFKAYLLRNREVFFSFRGKEYLVTFSGAAVFPQGFSAVADRLRAFRGVNMLCDIGNGTMNIMYINNGKPVSTKCYTEKFGTQQCMIAVRERLMQRFGVTVDDSLIEAVLRFGEAEIGQQYLDAIRDSASEYVSGIMRRLREHEYNPDLMKLYVVGGGSCLIKNFASFDPARVTINGDIRATAKGYELLAVRALGRKGNA
jgi:plasmid segregation protein ParM